MWTLGRQVLILCSLGLLARASLFDDILSALQNATDCASCQSVLLPPLQTLANLGDDAWVGNMTAVCQTLQLADDDVCAGTFNRSGRIISHDLRQISLNGTTAVKLCDAVFGLCQPPLVTPFNVTFPKPAPTSATKFISSGRQPFQVVHISDVHIDRSYTVGADANCTKNICCRNFADETGPVSEPAQPFGNSHCDSPGILAQSLIEAMNEIGNDALFSIFTGDVVEGATWLVTEREVTNDLADWNEQMAASLNLTIFPSIGNHDSVPVNSFPRNTSSSGVHATDDLFVFDTQSAGWEKWINATAADQVDHNSGSYAIVVPGTSLKIISMNTQYWYKQNYWLYDSDEQISDTNGLFEFMVEQLQQAEDAGQRAWIIGHIPSGKADLQHDFSNYYNQIVQRYKNTIAAQFAGHSHKDQFEIAYSDFDNQTAETADSIIFIGPALTPTSGNPAFKFYDVDPDTFEVMDAKVFMANISDPTFQTAGPTWELYYSARESYGDLVSAFTNTTLAPTDSLNASFWHTLTEVFESNDTAFQLWNTRISRGGAVTPCTGDCVSTTICDMRSARSENNCDVSTPGLDLRRDVRSVGRRSESFECEGGSIGDLLGGFIDDVNSDESVVRTRALQKLNLERDIA
ncbi:sphingomyelin phosphodiesterase [Stereum hirsutum FP-91666 SS1]|uniref:sphingomyelin phosphodiesterase n=1 Tax=Stereum hirsutum (strain FP-91666) TaxID=721885 RepID=UPI0004410182|nr:sphingomyelin phosphodiesterase [Stereum hirsutum FP-91666 SS1]EIM91606.1 sphingomyelin phosphodiesterase [Stereum hirsutum FP-91666 SS1]